MIITKILIAIDDSAVAEHAAAYGFDIARKFNAAVGLVNIVEPAIMPQVTTNVDPIMGFPVEGSGFEEMELLDIQKNQSENVVNQTIQKLAGDLQVTHFNQFGSTADGIITCSKDFNADLIVLGPRKPTFSLTHLERGVTLQVLCETECPVLTVC